MKRKKKKIKLNMNKPQTRQSKLEKKIFWQNTEKIMSLIFFPFLSFAINLLKKLQFVTKKPQQLNTKDLLCTSFCLIYQLFLNLFDLRKQNEKLSMYHIGMLHIYNLDNHNLNLKKNCKKHQRQFRASNYIKNLN